jgi:FPC/CPF motif-containing protein YcgG
MEIAIASDPERPNVFAEIREDHATYADVIYDAGKEAYLVTLYGAPGDYPVFDLAKFRRALDDAKQALVERGFPDIPT